MSETRLQARYREDARALIEIGRVLVQTKLPTVEVRIPAQLADQAVAAWEREDDERPAESETHEQKRQRHRAGTLALIGLSIAERGKRDGDAVVVDLDPVILGLAVGTADDQPSK
jgi:hypothetical protein